MPKSFYEQIQELRKNPFYQQHLNWQNTLYAGEKGDDCTAEVWCESIEDFCKNNKKVFKDLFDSV